MIPPTEQKRKLEQLTTAIHFLKRKGKLRNNDDIAASLEVSKSYISQILNAKKPLTRKFISEFEQHYKIKLEDPFSYLDIETVKQSNRTLSPAAFMELYAHYRSLIEAKNDVITKQQELIDALYQERDALIILYYGNEEKIVNRMKRKNNRRK